MIELFKKSISASQAKKIAVDAVPSMDGVFESIREAAKVGKFSIGIELHPAQILPLRKMGYSICQVGDDKNTYRLSWGN